MRNKSVVGLRSADLPTRGVTPTKGAMLTKGAVRRSLCTIDFQEFLDHELPSYLPPEKKSCSDLAETLHADLS